MLGGVKGKATGHFFGRSVFHHGRPPIIVLRGRFINGAEGHFMRAGGSSHRTTFRATAAMAFCFITSGCRRESIGGAKCNGEGGGEYSAQEKGNAKGGHEDLVFRWFLMGTIWEGIGNYLKNRLGIEELERGARSFCGFYG